MVLGLPQIDVSAIVAEAQAPVVERLDRVISLLEQLITKQGSIW